MHEAFYMYSYLIIIPMRNCSDPYFTYKKIVIKRIPNVSEGRSWDLNVDIWVVQVHYSTMPSQYVPLLPWAVVELYQLLNLDM